MSLIGNKLKNQIIFRTGTVLRASSFIQELPETLVDQITSKEFIDSCRPKKAKQVDQAWYLNKDNLLHSQQYATVSY